MVWSDLLWKTLLRQAFVNKVTAIIGPPLILLGLMKLKRYNETPLFVRKVIVAGYPAPEWMIDGLVQGFDCEVGGCFGLEHSGIVAGFACGKSWGVHLWEDMYGVDIVDEKGKSISPLYTWQDQSASTIIGEINQYTKHRVSSGYGLATHIYHIQKNLVPVHVKNICTIMDYFGMILTNRNTPLMHTSNAASLGFFDVEKNVFEKESLRRFDVDLNILPQVTTEISQLGKYQNSCICCYW